MLLTQNVWFENLSQPFANYKWARKNSFYPSSEWGSCECSCDHVHIHKALPFHFTENRSVMLCLWTWTWSHDHSHKPHYKHQLDMSILYPVEKIVGNVSYLHTIRGKVNMLKYRILFFIFWILLFSFLYHENFYC